MKVENKKYNDNESNEIWRNIGGDTDPHEGSNKTGDEVG